MSNSIFYTSCYFKSIFQDSTFGNTIGILMNDLVALPSLLFLLADLGLKKRCFFSTFSIIGNTVLHPLFEHLFVGHGTTGLSIPCFLPSSKQTTPVVLLSRQSFIAHNNTGLTNPALTTFSPPDGLPPFYPPQLSR